jgi:hypothetical protein
MFGRKRPQVDEKSEKTIKSERTTSYRVGQDAAPPTSAVKTTSYVNAMQKNGRGYETLN